MIASINIASTFLAIFLLHSLSRRVMERICLRINGLYTADAWVIYFVIFFSALIISFHIAATIAMITGAGLVHITTVCGILILFLLAEYWICGRSQHDKMLYSTIKFAELGKMLRSVDRLVQLSVIVAVAIGLLFFLEAVTRPPAGWDALVYHLPLALKWSQSGSLAFIQESWKFQMPSNGDIFPLFLLYFGNENILSLASLPFTLLAMLSLYSLARRLSASQEEALIAVLGFSTMPVVLYHSFSVMVDIFAAAFFLSSLCLILKLYQPQFQSNNKRVLLALIAGLAFGLGLGARYIYVPLFVFMAGLSALVVMFSATSLRNIKWKHLITTMFAFGIGSFLTSIFWFARNLIVTGNPMHPLQFSIGENGIQVSTKAIVEKIKDSAIYGQNTDSCLVAGDQNVWHWLTSPWQDCWAAGEAHYSNDWGLGAVFTTFIPVMTFAFIVLLFITTIRRKQIQPVHMALLVCFIFLTYWWTTLFHMIRSILPVIGILFVFVTIIISVMSDKTKRATYVLFLCAMITNGILLSAKPLQAISSRLYHETWSHSSHYNIPEMINGLPTGSVILNAADERRNYPLYGHHWQNQVITDRVLLEPSIIKLIDNDFIERWGIEYIYFDNSQNWTLADEVNRETLYEFYPDEKHPDKKEILYRIIN